MTGVAAYPAGVRLPRSHASLKEAAYSILQNHALSNEPMKLSQFCTHLYATSTDAKQTMRDAGGAGSYLQACGLVVHRSEGFGTETIHLPGCAPPLVPPMLSRLYATAAAPFLRQNFVMPPTPPTPQHAPQAKPLNPHVPAFKPRSNTFTTWLDLATATSPGWSDGRTSPPPPPPLPEHAAPAPLTVGLSPSARAAIEAVAKFQSHRRDAATQSPPESPAPEVEIEATPTPGRYDNWESGGAANTRADVYAALDLALAEAKDRKEARAVPAPDDTQSSSPDASSTTTEIVATGTPVSDWRQQLQRAESGSEVAASVPLPQVRAENIEQNTAAWQAILLDAESAAPPKDSTAGGTRGNGRGGRGGRSGGRFGRSGGRGGRGGRVGRKKSPAEPSSA
jgi:hypothetical protein